MLHCTPTLFVAPADVIWNVSPSQICPSDPASAVAFGTIVIVVSEFAETVQGAIGSAINVKSIIPDSVGWEI